MSLNDAGVVLDINLSTFVDANAVFLSEEEVVDDAGTPSLHRPTYHPSEAVAAPEVALRESLAREKALRSTLAWLMGELKEVDPENPALIKEKRFGVYQDAYRQALIA